MDCSSVVAAVVVAAVVVVTAVVVTAVVAALVVPNFCNVECFNAVHFKYPPSTPSMNKTWENFCVLGIASAMCFLSVLLLLAVSLEPSSRSTTTVTHPLMRAATLATTCLCDGGDEGGKEDDAGGRNNDNNQGLHWDQRTPPFSSMQALEKV